jgi:hypothetical protein
LGKNAPGEEKMNIVKEILNFADKILTWRARGVKTYEIAINV